MTVSARLWALAVRFVVVVALARLLPVVDVGTYGLVTATVAYVTFAMGLDLYAYTTRELINSGRDKWRTYLGTHGAFLVVTQVVFLPTTVLLFVWGLLPWSTLPWFLLLASTELVGNEIDRTLVAISEQGWASVVILIRQGLMPTLIIPTFVLFPSTRSLAAVFAAWVACNGLAIVVGVAVLIVKSRGPSTKKLDVRWLARGFKVSFTLLIGTLCLRALFSIDRQLVARFGGLETVGVYSLAMALAAGLTSLVAVGVQQFQYPLLVRWAHEGDRHRFIASLKRLWWTTVGLVVVAVTALAIFIGPFLAWVGKDAYIESEWVFVAAMLAVGIYNLSLVPHFALYALHADRAIVGSSVIAVVIWAGAWAALLRFGVIQAALAALLVASIALGVGKLIAYLRLVPASSVGPNGGGSSTPSLRREPA